MHGEGLWDSPAAEPDFEIGQERNCPRSRGQRRKTWFSRSGLRGGPAPSPRTAADRTGCSKPARFFCDIKDLMAVQAVWSEPVSGAEATISLLNREKTGNFHEFARESPIHMA